MLYTSWSLLRLRTPSALIMTFIRGVAYLIDCYRDTEVRTRVVAMSTSDERAGVHTTIRRLSAPQDFRTALLRDVKIALSGHPRWFPPKYRYDEDGSRICEEITKTPEYYLTRAEVEILRKHAKEIMQLVSPDELVELGSGSSTKTRILIEAMHSTGCHRYAPLDISESALREAAHVLTADYNWLEVDGQLGDFDTDLPKLHRKGRRLLTILGSSIGNYNLVSETERIEFLAKLGGIMVKGDALLLGVDLVKDIPVILHAYNDSKGLNRRLKMQGLVVMNHELDANFSLADFEYICHWDAKKSAVLSSLQAQREVKVSVRAIPLNVNFTKGEEILVGIACKFSREQITQELADVGLKVIAWYTDSAKQYGLLVASPEK